MRSPSEGTVISFKDLQSHVAEPWKAISCLPLPDSLGCPGCVEERAGLRCARWVGSCSRASVSELAGRFSSPFLQLVIAGTSHFKYKVPQKYPANDHVMALEPSVLLLGRGKPHSARKGDGRWLKLGLRTGPQMMAPEWKTRLHLCARGHCWLLPICCLRRACRKGGGAGSTRSSFPETLASLFI